MYKSIYTSLIVVSVCLLFSCSKDPSPDTAVIPAHPVFVVCEGSLGNGNSALTLYNPDDNKSIENIYQNVNGISLGDIFQSIAIIGDQYFLCINNSDRIIVINRSNLLLAGTISVPKPRYILPISNTKAFVSSIFSNKLFMINPSTRSVTDTVFMPFKNPEGMILNGNRAFVCTWDTADNHIHPFNTVADTLERPLTIAGRAAQEIAEDAEGMLWVLSGNKADGVESRLTRLNPATGNILKSYSFGTADPLRLVFNNAKDSLYFIEVSYSGGSANNGVYRMGIHDPSLPVLPFVTATGLQYFWGLGIQPLTGLIYIADPVGFTQRGKVYVYQPDGHLVNTFTTGVGPGHFLFD